MSKLQLCKLKARVAELERLNLPKVCYQTCELVLGANAGFYRRSARFGGSQAVQREGMSAFTGTNPNWPTQPWVGDNQGSVVGIVDDDNHFSDRSNGRNRREIIAYEAYLYIPAEHIQPVDEIRFLLLGQQFSQARISPSGGDLTAPITVGTVNWTTQPNSRPIPNFISLEQDEVYGVLSYVLDDKHNADTRIQYRVGGGAWTDIPDNWFYPNLSDAQEAKSQDIVWTVQGGIGINDVDDRRLTESQIKSLGLSSEEVICPDVMLTIGDTDV